MTEEVKPIYKKNQPVSSKKSNYRGFKNEMTILPKGYRETKKSAPLECDIIFERDVAVKLCDGTTIYTDIFRPKTKEKVPAIVSWSPYGKNGSGVYFLSMFPGNLGVHPLSGLQKFEGPDPAYWCKYGYAVCNPDTRGAYLSEGNTQFWGTQDGRDGRDYVNWVGAQSWCNGKVGLSGNSWLAIAQWFIAAEQPKALAAIAPWEGHSDVYGDDIAKGGIPCTNFNENVGTCLFGNGGVEDLSTMLRKYPLMNSLWEDRKPVLEKVNVPAYVVGSYSNAVHVQGTFRGFEKISSTEKWFRIHDALEWTDYYAPESLADLRKFFDHYLKGAENGWENTPRVRASILDPGGKDKSGIPMDSFPPKSAKKKTLYLSSEAVSLVENARTKESQVEYISDDGKGRAVFERKFDRNMTFLGYSRLKLWMEAPDYNDMDVFVKIEKVGKDGKVKKCNVVKPENKVLKCFYQLAPLNAIHWGGPNFRLRASRRHFDETKTTDKEICYTFDREEKLEKGQIVPLWFNLGPVGMAFHAGETLRLTVAGYDLIGGALPTIKGASADNKGKHIIHMGGTYDSCLQIDTIDSNTLRGVRQ